MTYNSDPTKGSFIVGTPATFNGILTASTVNTNTLRVADTFWAHDFEFEIQHVVDGIMRISPTLRFPARFNGETSTTTAMSCTKSGSTLTINVTDSSIVKTAMAGIVWSSGSRVKVSGKIKGVATETMSGTLSSINNGSLSVQVTGGNIANITATSTLSDFDDITIMVYERKDGSNYYPTGILINCYDAANKSATIKVYGGTSATPNVTVGNLVGLSFNGEALPTSAPLWGIHTSMGYFEGAIVSTEGQIGGFTIGDTTLKNGDLGGTTSVVMSIGTSSSTAIGGSSGSKTWAFAASNKFGVTTSGELFATSGEIGGWTIGTSSLYNTTNSMTSTGVGLYLGTDGIRNYASSTQYVNITGGKITALGVDVSGKIAAQSGAIGGFHITSSSNQGTSSAGGHIYTNSLYRHSGDGTTYEYEFGIKGDAAENPSSSSTATGNLAFYVKRINKGAAWNTTNTNMFYVTHAGAMYCTNADITGKITATSGKIGGWNIGTSAIYSDNHTAWNSNNNGVYIGTSGIAGGTGGEWWFWNDGSAKIGAMTLSASGVLAVPAANITGTLGADHIDVANISIGQSQVSGLSTALSNAQSTADAALGQSVWYATCSTEAATVEKVATITPTTTVFTLKAGATVNVTFTNTNSGAVGSITLNVNSTGAKNIKYINGTSAANIPDKGYIVGGRTYQFVYDGTYWVIQNLNYNSNNYDRVLHNNQIKAAAAITAGYIIVGTSSGYKHMAASIAFDMSYPILFAGSTITSGSTSTGAYEQMPSVKFSNNGTIQGFAVDKTIYLKGTLNGSTFTIASSNFITCTIPSAIDNYYYIPLGVLAHNATSSNPIGYFTSSDKLYAFINGAFQPVDMAARRYITDISNTGIKLSYVTNPLNYLQITGDDISIYKNINNVSTQVASYGESITLGQIAIDETRVQIDNDSLDIIYRDGDANDTRLAQFGSVVTIGDISSANIGIDNSGISINNSDGNTVVQISGDNFTIGQDTTSKFIIAPNSIILKGDDGEDVFKISAKSSAISRMCTTIIYSKGQPMSAGRITTITDENAYSDGSNDPNALAPSIRVYVYFRTSSTGELKKKLYFEGTITNTTFYTTTFDSSTKTMTWDLTSSGANSINSKMTEGTTRYSQQYDVQAQVYIDVYYKYKNPSESQLNMTGNMEVSGFLSTERFWCGIQSWHSNQFSNASGDIWADKCGNVVYVHGWHALNNGVGKEAYLITLPWKPVSGVFNAVTQNDAAGYNYSGYLDVLADGRIVVGTSWSGNTRYSFSYLTNDT